ncbi:hypothetical protein ThvES_00017660 [Thiovulum sp. ES]|nr:hypothetical protein ThvES_00017660 [Thiovulum sp. ES]
MSITKERLQELKKLEQSLRIEKAMLEEKVSEYSGKIEQIEPKIKEMFGTTDLNQLQEIHTSLLQEAESILQNIEK